MLASSAVAGSSGCENVSVIERPCFVLMAALETAGAGPGSITFRSKVTEVLITGVAEFATTTVTG